MSEQEPVTMVDVFEIPREDVEVFKAGWRERAALMSTRPGFRDARLLEAVSDGERFQLINVARWDSEEAWRAANGQADMQTARQKVSDDPRQRVVANTGLYRAAVTVHAPDHADA